MKAEDERLRKSRFWRKFLRLTRGRVTVLRALRVIAEEEEESSFRKTIESVRAAVERGATLSEALAGFGAEFCPSVVELVRTAEKTGAWDEILVEIAEGLEEGTFA